MRALPEGAQLLTVSLDGYQTLEDVPPGSPICVSSPVSNTQYWSVAMNELQLLAPSITY